MKLRHGSLFSGYGGLDLAIEEVFGARTVWVSDIEPGPCKVLAYRYPGVPNLGDITRIDWQAVAANPDLEVDLISGGSPCQDISTAGRGAGMVAGTRSNLWVEMREAIRVLRPMVVIWENVAAARSAKAASASLPTTSSRRAHHLYRPIPHLPGPTMTEHTCSRHPAGSDPCYTRHGCRCDPCRATHGREAKRRRHARATGNPARLDATLIVAHLRVLLASGMGRAEISRRAGLHGTNLDRLVRGDQRGVTPARAAAILAVQPTPVDEQQVGEVNAAGTRRRVQALMALGWHQNAIAADAGVPPCTLARLLDYAPTCFASTRRKVAATYDRLWDRTPPPTRSHLDSRARNLARRKGWPPPMAWDDDDGPHGIDNPAATPYRAVTQPKFRRHGELVAEVRQLLGTSSAESITRRLGYARVDDLATAIATTDRPLAARLRAQKEVA